MKKIPLIMVYFAYLILVGTTNMLIYLYLNIPPLNPEVSFALALAFTYCFNEDRK